MSPFTVINLYIFQETMEANFRRNTTESLLAFCSIFKNLLQFS